MPKVTRLAWPVATGLGGSLLKTDNHKMVRPDMVIEASGDELAELLGNARLAKVCQKMGHGRILAEFTGVTQLTETVNGEDFGRGLEISGATVEMSLNGDDSAAIFQGVHGVIWNRCHFTFVRSMTSKSEDSGELSRMTAVTAFFKECHQMCFKECTFDMKVTYRLQMEQLEYQEETEDSDWEGSSDTLSYGGGGGAGGAGGAGGGGWSSGQLSYEDTSEHPEEEEDEEYILPWTGSLCFAFWLCDNVTIFGGACTMESICNSTGGDACAVCLGLFQCNGPEYKGLEEDGSCSMPGGLMAGRIGWMNVSGVQKTGMRFTTTARATATPDATQDTCISLNAQAVSGGLMRCHYVTPVYTRVNCLSHAEVKPMASVRILGVSIARAFGYDDVLADLTNSGNEAVCSAEASHPNKRQTAGGKSQACGDLNVTGTDLFYSN